MPPFDRVKTRHFMPAFDQAFAGNIAEIEAIASEKAKPTFANTIEALERAGRMLDRAAGVFYNLSATDTNDEMQKIEREVAPRFAKHSMRVYQDAKLFRRVDALMKKKSSLGLTEEQARVLDRYHRSFIRSGAALDAKARKRMAAIAERLATLGTKFNQNVLADEQEFLLVLESDAELAGLPDAVRAAAAQTASERGHKGKHAISLSRSSIEPFLQFSARRDLREQAFKAWRQRGANGGKTDNRKIVAEILNLRAERSRLLGFKTAADAALEFTMAKTPANVRQLLMEVWKPARKRAAEERDALQQAAQAEGGNFKLAGWDWRYYTEKVRKAKFDVDEAEVKPYLQLDSVIAAAFDVATKLFGVRFKERPDLPVYHPDVRSFEVTGADGRHVGLFLADYFSRPSKRSGAWMSGWRDQHKLDTHEVRPIIVNVMNFAKGAPGEPSLLSIDDARTLFHEFGHGLHGLLSNVTYPSVSGTSVEKRLRRAALAALRALDDASAGAQEVRQALQDRHGGSRIAAAKDQGRAQFQPGFRHGRVRGRGDRRSGPARTGRCGRSRCGCVREEDAGQDRGACRDRHAPSHPPLPAHYRRLCVGLLQLHVVGGDGCRRVRRVRGERRHLRPGDARKLYENIYSAGGMRDPADAYKAFRGRLPTTRALLEKRGLSAGPGA